MNTQDYYVDCDELGYCVANHDGVVASFSLIEDAYNALREFQSKDFPENWAKVPPAMREAKRRLYGVVS
ncbi:hypothetical protein [Hydrogenovibrio thermophilus]|jgi:hypothetical protein|uniref:Uncharacterized protein n=1 Tax=Hydrogenovibrio thermophilus TaxID=265883 RepID=A0A410H571_9GAMM|nr:hypothetical protein [Hydrogenovibrio thermophilus]QAB16084.1 hypothetical protein EPV75_10585 [Hydrogenovibrio thermophilus]